jgi:hypothetical protein
MGAGHGFTVPVHDGRGLIAALTFMYSILGVFLRHGLRERGRCDRAAARRAQHHGERPDPRITVQCTKLTISDPSTLVRLQRFSLVHCHRNAPNFRRLSLFNWRLIMTSTERCPRNGVAHGSVAAFAQSTPSNPDVPTNPAPAEPVATSKRFACQTATQGFKGQEQRDQMQLCMAQARMDCLKQANDQKIVGPQRKKFLKSCAEE